MALTRANIAYNLEESPHRLEVPYEGFSLWFVFSSNLYKQNFYDRFLDNREKITESLTRRFGARVQNDVLCDLKLYTTIEKRGFLVMKEEDKYLCVDEITLIGCKMMSNRH